MRFTSVLFPIAAIIMFTVGFVSCSGDQNPVIPSGENDQIDQLVSELPGEGSIQDDSSVPDAVYATWSDGEMTTYQSNFIVSYVSIDPVSLKGEITSARNASAIGDVFDADLTQFLRYQPCANCLQMGAINVNDDGNILVEFKIRHPFENSASRPDLHVFDVRGILIAPGSTQFPMTTVHLSSGLEEPAIGNVGMLVNADGYTAHFDSLAESSFYFGGPKNYSGNINPYKRFFENPTGVTFDPLFPEGHNVMRTGAPWGSNLFELKVPSFGNINFVFIADCAYGVSATFQNRQSPLYYLPWFNRKEAWKVDFSITSNDLYGGNNQSSASIRVTVCDWQAGLSATPTYPNCALTCIPVISNVKKVTLEIPSITGQLQIQATPTSGSGSFDLPLIYDFTITNELSAPAGTYKGIIAVRDDLDGTDGPMGIPEGKDGIPIAGPDMKDYTTYYVFNIDVGGNPNNDPIIDTHAYSVNNPGLERSLQFFVVQAHDPDGDELEFLWEQISPDTPIGVFEDKTSNTTYWFAPNLTSDTEFNFTVTIDDGRGGVVSDQLALDVLDVNQPPVITYGPYSYPTIIAEGEYIDTALQATDPDNDTLHFDWFQISPAYPVGSFDNPNARQPRWTAPAVITDTIFKLRVNVSDEQYAASADISVPVSALNEAPVGTLVTSVDPPVYGPSRGIILYGDFEDPDGNNIVLYEWDEDYDGVTFDVDKTTGANPALATSFTLIGPRVIAIRASDNGDPVKKGIATCDVVIEGKWGGNDIVADSAPPSTKIESNSNQTPIVYTGDTVYATYLRDTGTASEIRLARSYDGGATYGPSVLVVSKADPIVVEGITIEVFNDYVWIAWREDNDVRFCRSTDGGDSFGSDISLSPISALGDRLPSMAYSESSGNLYAAFADRDGSSNGKITLTISADDGQSFTPSASNVTSSTAATSCASVKVTSSGTIFVGWIDLRNSANGDAFFARSLDNGSTFGTNRRINLDYSNAGTRLLSMDNGPDDEIYFAWLDFRESFWRVYFAVTTSGGTGVLMNLNATPIIPQVPSNPHIIVNDFGRIYIAFTGLDISSYKTMLTHADFAGAPFEPLPIQMNDWVTTGSINPMIGLSGSILDTGFADDVVVVWTDFKDGESDGFGDSYSQRYLCHAY